MESKKAPAPRRLQWYSKAVYQGLACPYCESATRVIDSALVYHQDDGWIMACLRYPDCDSFVRCHPHTMRATGGLGDSETRGARAKAHNVFDKMWRSPGKKPRNSDRKRAYKWLAGELGIDEELCHMGYFDADMCRRVISICEGKGGA